MPTPTRIKRRYVRELERIARRFDRLDDQTIRGMVSLLQDLRKSVALTLVEGSDFEQFRARQIITNVNQQIDDFTARLTGHTERSFRQAHRLGLASVVEPLTALEIEGVFFRTSTAQLNAIVDFSADLISEIGNDMRGKINRQIRLSIVGQRSAFDTMREITRILGVKSRDGIWGTRRRPEKVKGIAARAEAILRTETTRIYNLASHSQQLATAEQVPELRKRWLATPGGRTRQTHLNAHGQEQPVSQPFQVGNSQLMFPGDPRGTPEETINCRCVIVTIHPDFADVSFGIDARIQAEQTRRQNT